MPLASLISLKLGRGTVQLLPLLVAEAVSVLLTREVQVLVATSVCALSELCQITPFISGTSPTLARSCDKGVRWKILIRMIF